MSSLLPLFALGQTRKFPPPWPRVVNYLHHGDALDSYQYIDWPAEPKLTRNLLADRVRSTLPQSRSLGDLVRLYGDRKTRTVDLHQLLSDLHQSLRLREYFQRLKCRGFSYALDCSMDLYNEHWELEFGLRPGINLRVALVPGIPHETHDRDHSYGLLPMPKRLFFPPRVWNYLQRARRNGYGWNHYFCDGAPSIALALGRKAADGWYLFALQSDLASRAPTAVRDHFRGWRKVLLAAVLQLASGEVSTIYLCRAEDVLRACHPKALWVPPQLPALWQTIYNQTAEEFGFRCERVERRINIQLYNKQRPVYADEFYRLDLPPR